jgi:hypothetical protein
MPRSFAEPRGSDNRHDLLADMSYIVPNNDAIAVAPTTPCDVSPIVTEGSPQNRSSARRPDRRDPPETRLNEPRWRNA